MFLFSVFSVVFFLKHISLHLNFTKTCNENINIPDFTDEGIEVTE